MFVGGPALLSKSNLLSVNTINSTTLTISLKTTLLGVTLDFNLNFSYLISCTIQTSNFYIQAIKQVRKFVPLAITVTPTVSSVISSLDCCNFLLCGLPAYVFFKLQSLQNHAAKIVLQTDYFSCFRTCFARLHWLPVDQRSEFSLMWLVVNIFTTGQPAYSHDLLSIRHPHESLRSSQSGPLFYQPLSSNLLAHRFFRLLLLTYGTIFHPICARQTPC